MVNSIQFKYYQLINTQNVKNIFRNFKFLFFDNFELNNVVQLQNDIHSECNYFAIFCFFVVLNCISVRINYQILIFPLLLYCKVC